MTEVKTCRQCGAVDRYPNGRCRPCHLRQGRESDARHIEARRAARRERKRAWRAAKPEAERAANRRKRYGVTQTEVDALLARQNGACAICRGPAPDAVDHCHASGRIRGMLCRACNAGLGMLRDDPALLRAAAAYLRKPR